MSEPVAVSAEPSGPDKGRRKALGAYYTALPVVDFLVDWGTRSGLSGECGVLMDPSCGDGRFLAAAARRGVGHLIGCDLDEAALGSAAEALADVTAELRWHPTDFFCLSPEQTGPVDLIVGNPPFIRYQQFSGETRARALASALRAGARLSRLAASWAPFLLHALQFLKPGGAMGMVVPAELAQTSYGIETLRALCANFARVRLITFRQNWFDDAQQETFLLLASGRGGSCASAELTPVDRIGDLADAVGEALAPASFQFDADSGDSVGLAYLTPASRDLFLRLAAQDETRPLRTIGDVVNGYVSGANEFFHCTLADGEQRGLPRDWLLPVARNSRSMVGLAYTLDDVGAAEAKGVPHHLILPRDADLFGADEAALNAFKGEGERLGVPARYKCRVRSPWWRVPGAIRVDVLLPYMIGSAPHGAVNRAHALYPNSLHGLRLANKALAERLVLSLLSSLSLLSMELEGRSYGGGVLKLEPTEMQRVLVVLAGCSEGEVEQAFDRVDGLLRSGDFHAAVEQADALILRRQLGLSKGDVASLQTGRATLVERRLARSRRRR